MGLHCYRCLKFLAVVFNFLYMILGGVLLGCAVYMYLDGAELVPVMQDIQGTNYVLFFLMGIGAIMFFMGMLGMCGACVESQCMLATFFFLVMVLFWGQIAAGIWLKANEDRFHTLVKKSVAKSLQHHYGSNPLMTEAFDKIQRSFKCCGSEGPGDWAEARYNNPAPATEIGVIGSLASYKVPESCCVSETIPLVCEAARSLALGGSLTGTIHSDGCSKKMIKWIETHSMEVLIVLGAIVLVEILAMIMSMVLCCTVRRMEPGKV